MRVLPLVVFKKKITNRFCTVISDLYSICSACSDELSRLCFFAVDCIPAAAAGVAAGVIAALAGGSLFTVAISASAVVYVLLLIL